ncbi:MAG: hypothetical protein STSR0003_03510 [Smithella sp.]
MYNHPVPAKIAATPVEWKDLIGIQYSLRGEKEPLGLNCYGLVREVYDRLLIELPSREEGCIDDEIIATEGQNWIKIDRPRPYAVALLKMPSGNYHLGVVTPEMSLLHALPHKGVILSRLSRYEAFIVGYYSYKPGGGEALPNASGGNVGRTIGSLIVTVVAIVASVYTYGLAGGASAGWVAAAWGAAAGATVTLVGNMVVNALCPLPVPEIPQLSGYSGDIAASSVYNRYDWNGITNEASQGLVKPMIFGRIRTGGQIVSEKTWYDPSENEYLDMLICPSGHRITRFEDIRINDTIYTYFKGAYIDTRMGDDEQTMMDMFDVIHVQYSSGARIPYDASTSAPTSIVLFASKARITGARLTIVAPRGICEYTGGAYVARSVDFRIQYRKASGGTWAFIPGDGVVGPGDITETNSGFTGRITWGFDSNIVTTYIAFTLTSYATIDGTTTFTMSGYKVWYRKVGDSAWTLHNTYEFGSPDPGSRATGAVTVVINNLPEDYYQVRVDWYHDWCLNPSGTHNRNAFAISSVVMASQGEAFTINGDALSPTAAVSRTAQITGLSKGYYDFRLWRTTADQETELWSDDIYLKSYAEIIDAQCAYPNHALLGVRAMATDRLSGSRPKVTSIVTGPPLSVPPAADRVDTTVYADEGLVTGTGNEVNGINVDGLHMIKIAAALIDPTTVPNTYYWLVFMASDGYAQETRPLTKFYVRVETWELTDGDTKTRLYVRLTETVTAGASVMAFHEADAPTRNTAWAVALMLLNGSQGRITISDDHWPYWQEWNDWNEELVYNEATLAYEKRHQYDAVIDYDSDLWSTAFRAAATARAALVASGGSYRPVIDRAATEAQIFSEGNSANCRIEMIPKQDRPNILVTTFLDENDNYKQKTISEEDVADCEYPIVKTIPIQVGVVRESQVRRLLQYMLAQNRYITHTISLDAGLDAIECEVGDTFLNQSQAKDLAFSGRIQEVSGSNVLLDRQFTPEAGETYKLSIWGDGAIYTWQGTLSGTDIQEVPLPTGFVMTDMYEYPYMLTKLTAERTKYRLLGVKRPVQTMHSELAAIEYRSEVYAND